MNKDNIDRKNAVVSSKYFSTKSDMDESLSDFQEPRKITVPKNTSKKTKPEKPKRAPKKIRGQKDIRTALKSTKNELESYSKDFDHVCRQAGLEVDSEQLQVAIALSKSLQQTTSNSGDSPDTSHALNSQDRVGKIRTTLLEYGFKVPEIKKTTTSRRLKKRKHYKLLLTSEEVKKQIIADKYSQVLFENITHLTYSQNTDDVTHRQLYNLATNATYSLLKSIDTYYVNGLLEKSSSTGNLLRDWSEIPGRPESPMLCEPTKMNFSEIECSQDEINIVLSGSLKSCKNVLKSKEKEPSVSENKFSEQKKLFSTSNLDNSVIVLMDNDNTKSNVDEKFRAKEIMGLEPKTFDTVKTNYSEIINLEEPISTPIQHRSFSPDLFEDEPSTVIDDANKSSREKLSPLQDISKVVSASKNVKDRKECVQNRTAKENHLIYTNLSSQLSKTTNSTRFNDFMEITECIDVQCVSTFISNKTSTLKLSQNVTKRTSNDLMEITNCVVSQKQPLNIEADEDLTQSPETEKCKNVISGANETFENNAVILHESAAQGLAAKTTDIDEKIIENITSKHSSSEGTPKVISRSKVIKEINIDLTESPELVNNNVENIPDKSISDCLDLTQSSNTSEELPFVSLKTNKKVQSGDDTIIIDPKDYEGIEESTDNDVILTQNIMRQDINHDENNKNDFDLTQEGRNNESTENNQNPEEMLDLSQEIVITSRHSSKNSDIKISFFEDYVHNHSDNNNGHEIVCIDNYYKDSSSKENVCLDGDKDNSLKKIGTPNLIKSPSVTAKQNQSDDIDLTQNSESSEELSQISEKKDNSKLKHRCGGSEADSEATIEMEIGKGSQSDIDLTQNSGSEEIEDLQSKVFLGNHSITVESERESNATNEIEIVKSSQRCSSLGKKNDVSIDYDELYDDLLGRHSDSQRSRNSSKSATDPNTSNVSNKSKDISNCSQHSEVFVISDNELDYSIHQSKLEKPVENFLFGGISIMNQLSGLASFRKSTNIENNSAAANENILPDDNIEYEDNNQFETKHLRKIPVKHKRVDELSTPQKAGCSGMNTVVTPSNSQYVIKTIEVTPMPKYASMSLEELHNELDKFGVKPFKRKRAIQLLTHIYNQTHPTIEPCSDEESPCKRRKLNDYDSPQKASPRKLTPRKILSPKKTAKSPKKVSESQKSLKKVSKQGNCTKEKGKLTKESNERLNGEEMIQIGKTYEVNETPVIKEVECNPDDWVFQKREKAKVHSCRVPLHIAFHNYVSSRRELREAILCYEPVNIDDIHKDLVAYGYRYDPKDLLKFMDKKCITVKTTDNDTRNQKK